VDEEIDDPSGLSDQEMRVLELLAGGLSDSEIAARLGVSSQRLDDHLSSILRKLKSRSRTEAAVKAFKRRLLGVGVAAVFLAAVVVNASDTVPFTHSGTPGGGTHVVKCPWHS
jgi:DNA-binding CsgD family transcriptional regulator